MTTKSYSKHKEYNNFSTSGKVPYTEEQFDMMKSDLLPKNKMGSLGRGGQSEYHYEYREEKHPSGKYDRKDLHTVEQFTVPPKSSEHSTYYYEREERDLPAITNTYDTSISSTPGYSKVKTSKATKDLSHNVEELDSLLDDLQKDQERQLYKSGYVSDSVESTSFDYRKGTPLKAPSSGYSTLKTERVDNSSWSSSPPPPVVTRQELSQQMYREEKTESRVVPSQISPAIAHAVPAPVCHQCHHSSGTLTRSSTPMNKVTTTVKTYTYEVPADQDPTTVPIPNVATEERRYLSTNDTTRSTTIPPSPSLGCQYCSHCNSRISTREYTVTDSHLAPPPPTSHITSTHHYESRSDVHPGSERILYPQPVPEKIPLIAEPPYTNGHGPHGPTSYKWSETSYSAQNTTERHPSPSPFPRTASPAPLTQQTPKRLDDLLAEFPDARYPSQPDGIRSRRVEVTHQASTQKEGATLPAKAPPIGSSKNMAGPAVYYPPNHEPFAKKEGAAAYQASGGGAYASGRGMYEFESGSKSKMKSSETKTAVPICLPLCCAMPCVIM